ncbi:MAG: DUF4242 domain-containing protein [Bdellovibrionales bacterium]|nr:DUF4242 domain-containing protein [Bdellovibrionales bacterium]
MLNRYIIERNMPGVGAGTDQDFSQMAGKSNQVLNDLGSNIQWVHDLGSNIQWVHSYITDDKVICEYLAENEDLVRQHAKLGGFPADKIMKVKHVCDPTTAEDDFSAIKGTKTQDRESFLTS